jgi:hypothetical protein
MWPVYALMALAGVLAAGLRWTVDRQSAGDRDGFRVAQPFFPHQLIKKSLNTEACVVPDDTAFAVRSRSLG